MCIALLATMSSVAMTARAEGSPQPGQMASASRRLPSMLPAEPAALAATQNPAIVVVPIDQGRVMKRVWWASVAAVIAATSVDAASSWGHREANGLLASNGGNFGQKGVTLKVASASAVLVPQIIFRRRTRLLKLFAFANAARIAPSRKNPLTRKDIGRKSNHKPKRKKSLKALSAR